MPTREGYQLVHGPDSEPPTKGFFSPVGLGRQPHQQALSDFIVHTAWGAHQSGLSLAGFYRENSIRLDAGGRSVYPDCSFLLTRGREQFRFFAEIDNGTERVRSQKDTREHRAENPHLRCVSRPAAGTPLSSAIRVGSEFARAALAHSRFGGPGDWRSEPDALLRDHAGELSHDAASRHVASIPRPPWRPPAACPRHQGRFGPVASSIAPGGHAVLVSPPVGFPFG